MIIIVIYFSCIIFDLLYVWFIIAEFRSIFQLLSFRSIFQLLSFRSIFQLLSFLQLLLDCPFKLVMRWDSFVKLFSIIQLDSLRFLFWKKKMRARHIFEAFEVKLSKCFLLHMYRYDLKMLFLQAE